MTDPRRPPSSRGALPDAVGGVRDLAGPPPEPFPGDAYWYDLPDDDAAPEDDEGEAGARWRPWRLLRRR
ncbi:hypothetical protein GCM10010116_46010 [Microbispora rosea subsp. aerata]|nr:hypothetical protein [Microbispora rosea]GGO22791.1 hypothetical protein GCM10010116_46010 [Microbispora rosea subsp. aerata]GIH58276.1 hypothetical protein Mro02_51900 [Microbispora rosea subsp. aerata]GLJ82163.1 hypothetical protein GCM10017588_08880 [Microbispora rosea subsp. aerata]